MAGARLTVRVTPRASRSEIAGSRDGALVVKVTAPPEGGKANAAVSLVIAEALGVPKSSVSVVRGGSARTKVVEVTGVAPEQIELLFQRGNSRGQGD